MESQQIYNPTGGIAQIVLHPVGTPLPDFGDCTVSGVEVFLSESGSSYLEEQIFDGEQYYVRHTLTFCTPHGEGPYTPEELIVVARDGVVADVTLSSELKIRLGWSRDYGVEYPLRLTNMEFTSGDGLTALPTKRWVWQSVDCTPLTN